ncbi:ScyD/ScyE family protein [Ornithinimicrobium cavernae]|uniref:ScyD/ScyE family protein n=1 Tax=Ornithinimicrobium cavernae TaxID=2666047 RepID=UPI000D68B296|nr:ScyD/ScyE family protein [Ornithinimicrobium cavernae]
MPSLSFRVLGGAAAVCLATTALASAAAADDPGGTVVASGLDSPRHLTVAPNGDLYIAEAGSGGDDCVVLGDDGAPVFENGELLPCGSWDPEEHPDWGEVALGDSGAITRVSHTGSQERVVTGLPSAFLDGAEGLGPSDVSVSGNKLMVTVGLGAPPEARDMMVDLFGDFYSGFATVQQAKMMGDRVDVNQVVDLAAFETANNPHDSVLDTNPNAISADGNGWLLADAGGNDILRLDHQGDLGLVAVLQNEMVDAPPFLGLPPGTQIPMEPVPTSVERGPDGAVYISQLTGFPFPVGGSSIWRVAPDGTITEWATGLTNVTDLTFGPDGSLYAVQLANNGLLSGDLTGSLLRIMEGSDTHEVIATGMFAPYGVAVHHDHAYVTTGTVVPGGGEVVRFDLD